MATGDMQKRVIGEVVDQLGGCAYVSVTIHIVDAKTNKEYLRKRVR